MHVRSNTRHKDLWNPSLGGQLHCQRKRSNDKDRCAIAVVDDGVVVGHGILGIGSFLLRNSRFLFDKYIASAWSYIR